MEIEVRDANETIISTGVMTEMGPIFSPSIPQEIQRGFSQYIAEHSQSHSGSWEAQAGGKLYKVRFSN
jgi:hypothetical protein